MENASLPAVSPAETQVLRVVWETSEATVQDVCDRLPAERNIAYATVQTLLRKLEAKGAIGHDRQERTFVFYPLVRPEKVKRNATRELIDRLFEGSPAGLVAYLLKHERIDRAELDRIRDLVDGVPIVGTRDGKPRFDHVDAQKVQGAGYLQLFSRVHAGPR